MTTTFDNCFAYLLKNEGGLADAKADRGGITKYGISHTFLKALSLEVLRHYGVYGDPTDEMTIRELTLEQARAIYQGEFWNVLYGQILNADIGAYLFDMCVNMGTAPAIKCIQRASWAVMRRWELLPDDGVLGSKTIDAINQCGFMLKAPLRAERGALYRVIILERPQDKEFMNDWFTRTYNTP